MRAIVRVVTGLIGDREYFTRHDVEHDERARFRVIGLDRCFQCAIGNVLDAQIDTRAQFFTVARRFDAFDTFDGPAEPVLENALGARLTGQPVIECEFQAFLPGIVDIGEADEVPGDLTGRVVSPVLPLNIDARQLQREHVCGLLRSDMAFEVQELLIHASRDASHQQLRVEPENFRKTGHAIDGRGKLSRIRPDTVDGRADRQWFSVPVGDRAAVCRDLLGSQMPRVGFAIEKIFIDDLQENGPSEEGTGEDQKECCDKAQSQHKPLRCLILCPCAAAH